MDARTWTARVSECVGKQTFTTPQLAKKVQRRRRANKANAYARKQEVYHCRFCGQFHIGTKSKPRQDTKSGRRRRRAVEIEEDHMA